MGQLKLTHAKCPGEENAKEIEAKLILDELELMVNIPDGWLIKVADGQYDHTSKKVGWYQKELRVGSPLSLVIYFQRAINYKNGTNVHIPPNRNAPSSYMVSIASASGRKKLTGTYKVSIDNWTVSQLHVAQECEPGSGDFVCPPNGICNSLEEAELKWMMLAVKYKTIIGGNLSIDLDRLLQPTRNALSELDGALNHSGSSNSVSVVRQDPLSIAPSGDIVNFVIEYLEKKEVFIEEVIEAPISIVETEDGGEQKRSWEISGRYYPINLNRRRVYSRFIFIWACLVLHRLATASMVRGVRLSN